MPPSAPPIFNGQQPQRLACPAGSVMLFRSDIWHGAFYAQNEDASIENDGSSLENDDYSN